MKKHFQFINQGTVVQILCLTDEAKNWLEEYCQAEPWQWMGGISLCVELRMFDTIYKLIKDEFGMDSIKSNSIT